MVSSSITMPRDADKLLPTNKYLPRLPNTKNCCRIRIPPISAFDILWLKTKNWKYVHAQGVMLKKKIHRKIGLYDETLSCKSDREFFARVFNYGFKIGTVKNDVALYRRHKKQMHRSKEKAKINDKLQKEVLKKIEIRKNNLIGLEILK